MSVVAPSPRPRLVAPRPLLRIRSDAALAERFAAGDEAAFTILYERHRRACSRSAWGCWDPGTTPRTPRRKRSPHWRSLCAQTPPRELGAWLARVARNAAIDSARRRRRGDASGEVLEQRSASTTWVNTELDSVIAGLRELPTSQRTALLMRELAGHSYREIAVLLETDEDGVRGLIARARVGLRNHREATELSCKSAREQVAAEPDGRRLPGEVRRHLRGCESCRAYRSALRADARALRGLMPVQAGGFAGGALGGGLAAKGVLAGATLSQVGAACAVSVCAVGGIVLLAPGGGHLHFAVRAHLSTPHAANHDPGPATPVASPGGIQSSTWRLTATGSAPVAAAGGTGVGGASHSATSSTGGPALSSHYRSPSRSDPEGGQSSWGSQGSGGSDITGASSRGEGGQSSGDGAQSSGDGGQGSGDSSQGGSPSYGGGDGAGSRSGAGGGGSAQGGGSGGDSGHSGGDSSSSGGPAGEHSGDPANQRAGSGDSGGGQASGSRGSGD